MPYGMACEACGSLDVYQAEHGYGTDLEHVTCRKCGARTDLYDAMKAADKRRKGHATRRVQAR